MPDLLSGLFFEEKAASDAVLNVRTATGGGNVDKWVLIELLVVSVQGADAAHFDMLLLTAEEAPLIFIPPCVVAAKQHTGFWEKF
ncbi:hypothetical protein ETR_10742 [Erwinia tracheiphila PSU-1]|nr:hypothetical protein ETR_10742 [Erwinia tracheiphila PSU-1]